MITPIVDETEWRGMLDDLPAWQPSHRRALVISPHPDDETLGAGGLIWSLRNPGVVTDVVAVTDGEAAYPGESQLGAVREVEQAEALARLGVEAPHIHRLRLPDSGLGPCEATLVEALRPLIEPDTLVIAPWPHDYHPDHEVTGRAAEAAARRVGAPLLFYFFWTWHRGTLNDLKGLPLVAFPLSEAADQARRRALLCHRSQLEHGENPILPDNLLGPARRPYEVFLPS